MKEIMGLRGGGLLVAAQANGQIDAEMDPKDPFRMETGWQQKDQRQEGAEGALET